MNWQKAKTILIVFFVIVNIALLFYIVIDGLRTNKNTNEVTQTTVELLREKNIKADKDVILEATKHTQVKNIYVKNVVSDYASFAKLILGENTTESAPYFSEKGTVEFDGDKFFAKAAENNVLFDFDVKSEDIRKISQMLDIDFGKEKETVTRENGITRILFKKHIDDYEVFETGIEFLINDRGIIGISGNWYNEYGKNKTGVELKNVNGVMIDYMNAKNTDDEIIIEEIMPGYTIPGAEVYHESLALVPVWRITSSDGKNVYIDARENM